MKKILKVILFAVFMVGFLFGDLLLVYADEKEEFTLEEITVTAQKREENQQKIAIAMDVILGENLAETGKTNVDDILASISNVLVNMAPDGMRISVRGLTEDEMPARDMRSSTPMVAINIDGALNSSMNAGQNIFDVERVEILYGPQSTMYSSNSPGGVVNIVTKAPQTDKYSADISAEYGSYNLYNITFAGNAPIIKDKLGIRLSTQLYKRDDYVSDDVSDKTNSLRLRTLYQPNDLFSVSATGNYSTRIKGGLRMGNVVAFDYQDGYWYTKEILPPPAEVPWDRGDRVTNPWTAAPVTSSIGGLGGNLYPNSKAIAGRNQGKQYTSGLTGEIKFDTGIGTLSIVPQYSKTKSDDGTNYISSNDGLEYYVSTNRRDFQKGIESRMTSAEDFYFQWILGTNYHHRQNRREDHTNEEFRFASTFTEMMEKTKAIFANVTYPFTDKFRGIGGYRLSWTEGSNAGTNPRTGEDSIVISEISKHPDYRLGVEYDVADDNMVYLTYATSYRANPMGMMPMSDENTETLKAYTAGSKNRFFGNKLQVNLAAYYYDYRNKTATLVEDGRFAADEYVNERDIRDPDGNLIDLDGNGIFGEDKLIGGVVDPWAGQQTADKFRTIGADLSLDWIITPKDRLESRVSYLDATWQDIVYNFYYKLADGNLWETDGRDFSGYRNTHSPKWTINASYEHNFFLGDYGNLSARLDLQYKTDYFLEYANQIVTYQEPFYWGEMSLTYIDAGNKWSLNGYVKNITNYAYKSFYVRMGNPSLGISAPRTYGMIFSLKF